MKFSKTENNARSDRFRLKSYLAVVLLHLETDVAVLPETLLVALPEVVVKPFLC